MTFVSATETEIIIHTETEFLEAYNSINSVNHTTITLANSLNCSFAFTTSSGLFTLRSIPGQVYTITFAPTVTVFLTNNNTSNNNITQTFKDLILARPDSDSTFIHATSLSPPSTITTNSNNTSSLKFINVAFLATTQLESAIYLGNTSSYFENCRFERNKGAGVFFIMDSPTTFTGCTFFDNSVAITAGRNSLIYQITITNSLFDSNKALIYGGPIACNNVGLKISNSQFYNNTGFEGGTIYFAINLVDTTHTTNLEIISSKFDNNSALAVSASTFSIYFYFLLFIFLIFILIFIFVVFVVFVLFITLYSFIFSFPP